MLPTGNGPGMSNILSTQQMYHSMNMQYQPITNNQATSCSVIQPTLSQQLPTDYFLPLPQQSIIPTQQHFMSTPTQQPIALNNETLPGHQIQRNSPQYSFQPPIHNIKGFQQISHAKQSSTHEYPNQVRIRQTPNNTLPETGSVTDELDEKENEMETTNTFAWQQVKKRKFSMLSPETRPESDPFSIATQNRYDQLSNLSDEDMPTDDTTTPDRNVTNASTKEAKPPPIFIYGVTNFNQMVDYIASTIEQEQYTCKTQSNDTIKINVFTPDSYRKLIRKLKEDKVIHHTYQIRQERAYKVFIRHLHYSIPIKDIKQELEQQGHAVRNIVNIRHRVTKEPLSLFCIELEPKDNNKHIYDIKKLGNTIITVEAPRKKNTIVQCTRCQSYGHTKTYCAKPYACVKCGGAHNSTICKKPSSSPARCALCKGNHPANYKGCDVYRHLQQIRGKPTHQLIQNRQPNININDTNHFPALDPNQPQVQTQPYLQHSYAQVLHQNQTSTNIGDQLSAFLTEFKAMFSQLINQNGMILNMLNTVIHKLAP